MTNFPPKKSDCSSQQKGEQKEKNRVTYVKETVVNRAPIRRAYILYAGGRLSADPHFRSSVSSTYHNNPLLHQD